MAIKIRRPYRSSSYIHLQIDWLPPSTSIGLLLNSLAIHGIESSRSGKPSQNQPILWVHYNPDLTNVEAVEANAQHVLGPEVNFTVRQFWLINLEAVDRVSHNTWKRAGQKLIDLPEVDDAKLSDSQRGILIRLTSEITSDLMGRILNILSE